MTTGASADRTARASAERQELPRLPRRVPLPAPVFRVLPGVPQSAKAARTLTRELLGAGHPAAHTVMLLVSELVANAVLHSRSGLPGGTVTVGLSCGPAGVLIQVRDDGGPEEPRLPADRQVAAGAQNCLDGASHGYGLVLVAALADTWGTAATREGRVTWCRLAAEPCSTRCAGQADAMPSPCEGKTVVSRQETKV